MLLFDKMYLEVKIIMEVSFMTKLYKTGERVEISGVYHDGWGQVEILKKGAKFPKDPVLGDIEWKLVHYPFTSQITSNRIPQEFRNEITISKANID